MLRRTLGDLIQLKVDCPDTVPAALADATQLDTALVNLSLNARDAMPRGGEITLAASEKDEREESRAQQPPHPASPDTSRSRGSGVPLVWAWCSCARLRGLNLEQGKLRFFAGCPQPGPKTGHAQRASHRSSGQRSAHGLAA